MSIPFSIRGRPALGEIRDVNINPATLANGDTIYYESTTSTWNNIPASGGGSANVTGPDNFALFKSGTNGVADPNCICRVPGTPGSAIIINPATKCIGLGFNNPVLRLEVNGVIKAAGAASTNLQLIPSSSAIGMVSNNPLVLFSNNALTSPNATIVDSVVNNIQSSSFRSYPPTAFDVIDTTDTNSIYKVKLQNGINLWNTGGGFDTQEPFTSGTFNFPTGQIVEYQNNKPIQYPKIIGQLNTATLILTGGTAFVSYFGFEVGSQDHMIYDPMGMRAFRTGGDWTFWGAPSLYRQATDKFIINVKFFLSGDWTGFDPSDELIIYIFQYRSGSTYQTHELVRTTPNTATSRMRMSGERTLLGFVTGGPEEFDASTDYYTIEIANMSTANNFNVTRFTVVSEFIFAQ